MLPYFFGHINAQNVQNFLDRCNENNKRYHGLIINSQGGCYEYSEILKFYMHYYFDGIIACGECSSAAFYLFLSFPKEKRWVVEGTRCLIHPSSVTVNSRYEARETERCAKEMKYWDSKMAEALAKASGVHDKERAIRDMKDWRCLDSDFLQNWGIVHPHKVTKLKDVRKHFFGEVHPEGPKTKIVTGNTVEETLIRACRDDVKSEDEKPKARPTDILDKYPDDMPF